jgi:hypothetical protein
MHLENGPSHLDRRKDSRGRSLQHSGDETSSSGLPVRHRASAMSAWGRTAVGRPRHSYEALRRIGVEQCHACRGDHWISTRQRWR